MKRTPLGKQVHDKQSLTIDVLGRKPAVTKQLFDRHQPIAGVRGASCTKGKHTTCFKLSCSCECHGGAL